MSVELRVLETTYPGVEVPFYKVNYTKAQLNQYRGAANRRDLYDFQWTLPNGYVAEPMLSDLRAVFIDGFVNSGNGQAALNNVSGTVQFLDATTGNPTNTGAMVISPGNATWVSSGDFDYLSSSLGSNSSLKRFGRPFGPMRLSTAPLDGQRYQTPGSGVPVPRIAVMTAENELWFLDISFYQAGFGSQTVSFNGLSLEVFAGAANPNLKDRFIKDVTDGEEPDMTKHFPRTSMTSLGVYLMNYAEASGTMASMWDTDIMDSFRASFMGDGSNAILGLNWFYGINQEIARRPIGKRRVKVGNVQLDSTPVDVAATEFVEFRMESVSYPRYFGDYRDYTAVAYKAHLPFVGLVELDPHDVVGYTLLLRYFINITDGTAVCELRSTILGSPGTESIIFSTNCQWGYSIPIQVDNVRDVLTTIVKLAGGGGFVDDNRSYSAGSLQSDANILGDMEAYLVAYPRTDLTEGLQEAEGMPATKTAPVSNFTGYLKARVIYNSGTLAMRRSGEIIELLQEGIYI